MVVLVFSQVTLAYAMKKCGQVLDVKLVCTTRYECMLLVTLTHQFMFSGSYLMDFRQQFVGLLWKLSWNTCEQSNLSHTRDQWIWFVSVSQCFCQAIGRYSLPSIPEYGIHILLTECMGSSEFVANRVLFLLL